MKYMKKIYKTWFIKILNNKNIKIIYYNENFNKNIFKYNKYIFNLKVNF